MHSSIHRTLTRSTDLVRITAMILSVILMWQSLYSNTSAQRLKVTRTSNQSSDEHVRQVIESLEQDNTLRFALERGDRGNGVHYFWMDMMKQQGIKQASFRIRFVWCSGSEKLEITDIKYLRQYYRFDTAINDRSVLSKVRYSGLKQALSDEILTRARVDLNQRARALGSNTICGTLYLNLLDDEFLPILDEPANIDYQCENACDVILRPHDRKKSRVVANRSVHF